MPPPLRQAAGVFDVPAYATCPVPDTRRRRAAFHAYCYCCRPPDQRVRRDMCCPPPPPSAAATQANSAAIIDYSDTISSRRHRCAADSRALLPTRDGFSPPFRPFVSPFSAQQAPKFSPHVCSVASRRRRACAARSRSMFVSNAPFPQPLLTQASEFGATPQRPPDAEHCFAPARYERERVMTLRRRTRLQRHATAEITLFRRARKIRHLRRISAAPPRCRRTVAETPAMDDALPPLEFTPCLRRRRRQQFCRRPPIRSRRRFDITRGHAAQRDVERCRHAASSPPAATDGHAAAASAAASHAAAFAAYARAHFRHFARRLCRSPPAA